MLRPASLLSTEWTLDAPLGRQASLPSPGACYRALRRLPGQVLHLLEERVFQDAPCPGVYRVTPALLDPSPAQMCHQLPSENDGRQQCRNRPSQVAQNGV